MEDWLFFYGIDMGGDDLIIDKALQMARNIFPDAANAPLSGFDSAPMAAELAQDITVFHWNG